jgi:hypothetical protein
MPHSDEFRLRAMRHSPEFYKKFFLRLRAMPFSVKFKSKIFLPTPRYAAHRGVDSALCRIAGSRDSAVYRIAQSCDSYCRNKTSPHMVI